MAETPREDFACGARRGTTSAPRCRVGLPGSAWSLAAVRHDPGHVAGELFNPSGTVLCFTKKDPATGYYQSPAGVGSTLQKVADGWIERLADHTQLHYDTAGRLERIVSVSGDTWTLSFANLSGQERLRSVLDPFGRRTTLSYDGAGCRCAAEQYSRHLGGLPGHGRIFVEQQLVSQQSQQLVIQFLEQQFLARLVVQQQFVLVQQQLFIQPVVVQQQFVVQSTPSAQQQLVLKFSVFQQFLTEFLVFFDQQ